MKKNLLLALFVLAFASIGAASAHAGTLKGWAWSENIGWVSFNSTDAGAGGGPYSVTVDGSGNWSGYAWSPNIGWISFNVADVLSAGCPGAAQVRMPLTGGTVTGVAFLKAYGASLDGCLEMTGANHTLTFDASTGKLSGYAWNGDTATKAGIGWLDMSSGGGSNGVTYGAGSINGTCSATTPYQNIPANSSVTFQGNPSSGSSPYQYNWNGAGFGASNQTTVIYPSSGSGPSVIMKDSLGAVSPTVYCPNVVVASTDLFLGKTAATASSASFSAKKNTPFAVKWNMTLTTDYSCAASVSPSTAYTTWSSGFSSVDNPDGVTKTWAGDTGNSLLANTTGVFTFRIACTSSGSGAPVNAAATLKVSQTSENEI